MSRRFLRSALMMALGSALTLSAQAQSSAANGNAQTPTAVSAEERAQQQADKVFTWIRLHAEKPQAKRNAAAAEPATPSAAPAKVAAKPSSKAAPATATAATPGVAAPTVGSTALAAVGVAAPPSQSHQEPPQASAQTLASAAPSTAIAKAAAAATPEPPAQLADAAAAKADAEPLPLRLLHKVEPEVPRQLQRDFRGGSVTLRFTVMADGSVEQAEAVNASNKRLASAAVAALSQWRFAPIDAPRVASVEIGFQVE